MLIPMPPQRDRYPTTLRLPTHTCAFNIRLYPECRGGVPDDDAQESHHQPIIYLHSGSGYIDYTNAYTGAYQIPLRTSILLAPVIYRRCINAATSSSSHCTPILCPTRIRTESHHNTSRYMSISDLKSILPTARTCSSRAGTIGRPRVGPTYSS